MKTVVNKMGLLAKEIAAERGRFTVFAYVLREDAIAWDLVVAAPWIDADNMGALRFFAQKLQRILTKDELLNLSGVILLRHEEFSGISSDMTSDTGREETDIDFFGRHIEKGYVFVAPTEDMHLSPVYN
jgi:hypothetical protein